jgi:hypothetical protein
MMIDHDGARYTFIEEPPVPTNEPPDGNPPPENP